MTVRAGGRPVQSSGVRYLTEPMIEDFPLRRILVYAALTYRCPLNAWRLFERQTQAD